MKRDEQRSNNVKEEKIDYNKLISLQSQLDNLWLELELAERLLLAGRLSSLA